MGINAKTGEEELSYDTHADCEITVNGSANGVLAVGTNIISATTVCKDESGKALTIDDIIVTICANTDGTYTYIVSGIGYDGADYYTLDENGAVTTTEDPDDWPENWSEYRFDATKNGDEGSYLWVFSDGTLMFGSESDYNNLKTAGMTGGTTGWWGYVDGTLTFVVHNTSTGDAAMPMTDNADGSVTITGIGRSSTFVATITDIGCLVGDGYDLSTLDIVS